MENDYYPEPQQQPYQQEPSPAVTSNGNNSNAAARVLVDGEVIESQISLPANAESPQHAAAATSADRKAALEELAGQLDFGDDFVPVETANSPAAEMGPGGDGE